MTHLRRVGPFIIVVVLVLVSRFESVGDAPGSVNAQSGAGCIIAKAETGGGDGSLQFMICTNCPIPWYLPVCQVLLRMGAYGRALNLARLSKDLAELRNKEHG